MAGGVPNYLTAPGFSFRRSYIAGIYFRHDTPTWGWDGTHLQVVVSGAPDALVTYTFHENFVPWSSNSWTLDFILTDAVYEYPPNPTQLPLPYNIGYITPQGENTGFILLDCIFGENFSKQMLPAQPGTYWLPPPYQY